MGHRVAGQEIRFTLNGEEVLALPGETILLVAQRTETTIPHLCHQEGLRADGNCRACMVEIVGERALAASCLRKPSEGMVVWSNNKRAQESQRLVVELLQSETTTDGTTELDRWADHLQVTEGRFGTKGQLGEDDSHPAIRFNPNACILCTRCLRACREVQVNEVIGLGMRGGHTSIIFDLGDRLGQSSCVSCGECVAACPTNALNDNHSRQAMAEMEQVDSICPYCGVGCQLTYHISAGEIAAVTGRNGPANQGRLCVKGRYGFDYVNHRDRLTRPLIRREDAPKRAEVDIDPNNPLANFREASWGEALERVCAGFLSIRESHSPSALAGFGSAKGSNEEAYLFQKLIRTGFGTNNVDHCTRLCHASSVAALLQMIGSGAVSNPVADVTAAEVIVVIGSNTTENHPVAATFMKGRDPDQQLIVMDPRRTAMARNADIHLQFLPDTDVAMLNAILHTIIDEGLEDSEFIATRTEGYDELRHHLQGFSAEKMAPICGIAAKTLRHVARLYASAKGSMIFWGMGVSQHTHGTDNARCLINMALLTGQIGRPGTGLHPLRGQNNVQGASDAGLIPMVFPDYQRVDNPKAQARFEQLWNTTLDNRPGLTVVEIMHAILKGQVRGLYIMGENPAMSDPNLNHTRRALAALDHLVVQDIFMTETASYADVILPATAFAEKNGSFTNTDRTLQLGRKAVEAPGEARPDLEIIIDIAKRIGLDWDYHGPTSVFNEMRRAMPSIAGITWERLEREGALTYPCRNEGDVGEAIIFTDTFPTENGRAKMVPSPYTQAAELPDDDYPWVLITGRVLEHWHTGAMTRRSEILDTLQPDPIAMLNPADLEALNLRSGDVIRVSSRRGTIVTRTQADSGVQPGQIFIPFCYHEAAANLLTNEALDPDGKIPEFKFCAVVVAVP